MRTDGEGTGIMDRHNHLHLENLPWPVSVLTFNGAVRAMRTGDELTATLRDPDVVGNLCLLLGSQADLQYDVRQTAAGFRIEVARGGCPGRR